ncbi:hypothetical protein [Mesorhizobium sp. WSM2239]|uniref:LysM domain-containing protein n=2 Tax=unclassified Mesorhizobium TaxID=325217 RepID=A0AAU8DGB6_9HYPH
MALDLFNATVKHFGKGTDPLEPGPGQDVPVRITLTPGDPGQLEIEVLDLEHHTVSQKTWTLGKEVPTTITTPEVFTVVAPGDMASILGFSPSGTGVTLAEVRIEIRPHPIGGAHSNEAPFAAFIFCWDIDASTLQDFKTTNDVTITSTTAFQARVCAGIAFQHPPAAGLGLSNVLVRFDVESLGIGSGWIPLGGFDLVQLEFPPLGLPDEFYIPPLLFWLREIGLKMPDGIELPDLDWDFDFPDEFDLPLGVRFRETHLRIYRQDGNYRIDAMARELVLSWGEFEFEPEDVELHFRSNGDTYLFYAQVFHAQYPSDGDDRGEVGLSLPFGVLGGSLRCARVRVGVFGHNNGGSKYRFCFDTLVEIGGLKITSSLAGSDGVFYEADLRLLLRDGVLMTAVPTKVPTLLFEGLEGEEVFKDYANQIPAHSFAENLREPAEPGAPNEYGLSFLDGDFRPGERLFVAWSQKGNQLLEALAHDLLGRPPAGVIPSDAQEIWVALELLFPTGTTGERELQARLDWQKAPEDTAATLPSLAPLGAVEADTPAPANAPDDPVCIKPGELGDGIALPQNGKIDKDDKVPPGAHILDLPGVRVRLARAETQTILLRSDAERGDSIAYLLQWFDGSLPDVANDTLVAEVGVDFSLTPDRAPRQVQESGGETPGDFLNVKLGYERGAQNARSEAIQVLKLRRGAAPDFLQVYRTDAPRLSRLLPVSRPPVQQDACPERELNASDVASVLLPEDVFSGFSLRDASSWRLLVSSTLVSSILKMFGQDDADKGRRVSVEITEICLPEKALDYLLVKTRIKINLFGGKPGGTPEIEGDVAFRFDLKTLALSVEDGAGFALLKPAHEGLPSWAQALNPENKPDDYIHSDPLDIAGLQMFGIAKSDPKATGDQKIRLLTLEIEAGRFLLMAPEGTDLLLRYDELGEEGLTFLISTFELGPAGLNLSAELLATKLKVPGLKRPFALNTASLSIRNSDVERIEIGGSGQLPDLLNEAPVEILVVLEQNPRTKRIFLSDFECTLGDGNAPIFSKGTRCKFEITRLSIGKDDANGTRPLAWFFLVSGALQFTPDRAEFSGELLEDFSSIRLEFENAPLGDEFFEHVELIVTLREPKRFKVFYLFEMEVRSIGFHPKFTGFKEDGPAIIIGGQCAFADLGDVLAVEIDFHRCYLGFPAEGEILPQVHFKGLRVEIATGGFKIAGRVDTYDATDIKGFAGEGTIVIPGLPELSAAFAFVKLRTGDGSFKRAWFIAIEAARISIQIGSLPLYLRQVGLGFGYRYTSVIIKRFEEEEELGPLIALMLKEISRHQSLARIDTWAPDPERAGEQGRWSIGMEAVFSMASANSTPTTYDAAEERKLQTVVAQLLVFIRSDLTFLAAAKVWLPISTDDFFENREGMRNRPLALGFMIYSAPKSRLLIHAAKGKNPYLGPKDQPVPETVKKILDNSHFEATFLSEPGLVHAELGWPDRLFFRFEIGSLKLECRGGILFRATRDILVQGIYFSAHGSTNLGGGLSVGIVGVQISAKITVSLAMRLMIGISLSRPLQSNIYAVVGLDVAVDFQIYAWFRLNLRFCKIEIDLHFPLRLQIIVALELGWAGGTDLGFRGRATVMISVFGRGLTVRVAVGVGESGVNRARAALEPYMRSFLEPGAIPPIPGLTSERAALTSEALAEVEAARSASITSPAALERKAAPSEVFAPAVLETVADAFALALVKGPKTEDAKRLWIGWVMPNVQESNWFFYPVPTADRQGYATLIVPGVADVRVFRSSLSGSTVHWTEVGLTGGNHVIEFVFDKGNDLEPKSDDGQPLAKINLITILAGCYEPMHDENIGTGEEPFPLNWERSPFALRNVRMNRPEVKRDDRLLDPNNPAQSPKRQLDPDHPYDKALMRATDRDSIEHKGDAFSEEEKARPSDITLARRQLRDQALGNQSFLLRSFADDAQFLAANTPLVGDVPQDVKLAPGERPTLAHMGLVVAVVAETCPDWLRTYPGTDNLARATLDFTDAHKGEEGDVHFSGGIKPVIDFDAADFETNPPTLDNLLVRVDSETLNIGWDLVWGPQGIPRGEWELDGKDGKDAPPPDPEDFLWGYRVELFVEGIKEAVDVTTAGPGDLLVPPEEAGDQRAAAGGADHRSMIRLKLRYQFNKALNELGLGRELSVQRSFTALITPIAQDGTRGKTWTATASQVPSATPMPADDAALKLKFDAHAAEDGKLPPMRGTLEWRELVPPTRPDVATTQRWQLILRPLPRLPLGAYPLEATDTSDAGIAGVAGLSPQNGDIIVALKAMNQLEDGGFAERRTTDKPSAEGDGVREPMLQRWLLPLNGVDLDEIAEAVLDYRGRVVPPGSALRELAQGFFNQVPATEADGAGWRVFLRAMADAPLKPDEMGDPEANLVPGPASAMVRVRFLLEGQASLEESTETSGATPLDHLEWVSETPPHPGQVPGVETVQGRIHNAAIVDEGGELKLKFLPQPGRDRGVTISWSAVSENFALEQVAAYELYEAPMDALVNFSRAATADGKPVPGFGPRWQKLREIRPADREIAQRAVTSFVQPEIWDSTPPSARQTVEWMVRKDIPPEDMPQSRPGWYSWAESELLWPDWFQDAESTLVAVGLKSSDSPFFEAVSKAKAPGDLTWEEILAILAARRDLGEYYAKRRVHPWLLMVIGTLAARGAPKSLGGTDVEASYEVEISPGKLFLEPEGGKPDPVKWVENDLAQLDPLGWGALSQLGLAATIALRDPLTGVYWSQAELRAELSETLDDLQVYIQRYNELVPEDLESRHAMSLDARHVALDLPLQTNWAIRAEPGMASLSDNRTLAMLQLALRPVPEHLEKIPPYSYTPAQRAKYGESLPELPKAPGPIFYEVLRVELDKEEREPAGQVWFRVDVEVIYPEREGMPRTVFGPADNPIDVKKITPGGELLLVRWQYVPSFDALSQQHYVTERLQAALENGDVLPINEVNDQPLPQILSGGGVLAETPFGRFDNLESWADHVFGFVFDDSDQSQPKWTRAARPPEDSRFGRFIGHLIRAFTFVNESVEEGQQAEAENHAREEMTAKIYADEKLLEKYMLWAERFFAAAPIVERTDPFKNEQMLAVSGGILTEPDRLTAVAPKRIDPARLAPGGEGLYSYTHPVKEDWASQRAYAVRLVPRWWDLRYPNTAVPQPDFTPIWDGDKENLPTPEKLGHSRSVITIPRRRKVEPVKLIGLRNVFSDEGREFTEISLSDHVEAHLSRANVALARKLEFQDIMRRFSMEFRHVDWLVRLARFVGGSLKERPEPSFAQAEVIEGEWTKIAPEASFEESTSDYLSAAPIARFGGQRLLTPTEPFYFRQQAEFVARAKSVKSSTTRVRLPVAAALPPRPQNGKVDSHEPIAWAEVPGGELDALDGLEKAILDAIGDATLKERICGYLRPWAYRPNTRFPRLFEALPAASLGTYFKSEADQQAYGKLPDFEARLEIVSETRVNGASAVRNTIAVIDASRAPEGAASHPFLLRRVSSRYEFGELRVPEKQDWFDGLTLSLVIAPRMTGPATAEITPDLSRADEPSASRPQELVDSGSSEQLLGPNQMPVTGPLAQLLPLWQRLAVIEESGKIMIRLCAPLKGPRWLCRAQMSREIDLAPLSGPDLKLGIRTLLDVERRRALAMVGVTEAGEGLTTAGLLRDIEDTNAALLSDILPAADLDAIKGVVVNLLRIGQAIYRLRDRVWDVVTGSDDLAEGDRLLLSARRGPKDPETETLFDDYAKLAAKCGVEAATTREPRWVLMMKISEISREIAEAGYLPSDSKETLTIMAHHGNLAPVEWDIHDASDGGDAA